MPPNASNPSTTIVAMIARSPGRFGFGGDDLAGAFAGVAGVSDGRWPPGFSIFAMFGMSKDYHLGLRGQ